MTDITPSEIIQDVVFITPEIFSDDRGMFIETWRKEWIPSGREMVQSNRADRKSGSLVGLHYHLFQSDYWYVPAGSVQVILYDLREGSPTVGNLISAYLGVLPNGEHNHQGIYIPPGVAHGFAALSDMTITYLVDSYYNPEDELGVAWNDPDINAPWNLVEPTISERDSLNPLLSSISPSLMPKG